MAVTRVNQGEIVEVPIDQFNVDEVMGRNNTYLKANYFDYVVDEIIKNVIGGEDE